MTIAVRLARDPEAVRDILRNLPDWFGDAEAIDTYADNAGQEHYPSLLAYDGSDVVGVALVERHFAETAELHLIAVDPRHHGRGIGRMLGEHVAEMAGLWGCRYLSVHTVGPSFDSEPYARTRDFYRSMGFAPLEEHRNIDWPGPTLILERSV